MKEQALRDLLNDLSLEEKIGQLLQIDGSLLRSDISFETGPASKKGLHAEDKRLCGSVLNISGANRAKEVQKEYMENHPHHIPLLFMLDVINGYRTVFPIPLAQGCTFSPDIIKQAASITAAETSTDGVHVTFSPMSDLVQDVRWGRVMESTGEDPYLNSLMTAATVSGYQGDNLEEKKLASCMKHFAGYGSPVAGREYNTVEISERTLLDDHMPAYKAAIDAGCKLVMTSFNTLNRIPSTANKHLLQDILRQQFGFDGVVISDYNSVEELITHGIAADKKDAAKLAFTAGLDVEMCTSCYVRNLQSLLADENESAITMEALDEAVWRVLTLKNDLGLFENPYKDADETIHNAITLSKEYRDVAKKVCEESFVLLKNTEDILPLSTNDATAFIGPYVDEPAIYGVWSHQAVATDTVTIREGVKKFKPTAQFAKGSSILNPGDEVCGFAWTIHTSECNKEELDSLCEEAVEMAGHVKTVVLCLGEHRAQTGEGGSHVDPSLPACQLELLKKVAAVNSNIVLVLFSGRPMILTEIEPYCKAILTVWFPGTEGGNAIASVLYGESEPGGRLSMSLPRHVGQAPMTYRELRTGRPISEATVRTRFIGSYQDCPNSPLYPFGYGLGYTEFSCSTVQLDKETLHQDEVLTASVTVTNVGDRKGRQIVQLYLWDPVASVCRPSRELKGFESVELAPGASTTVSFQITEPMLRFYDLNMQYKSEPGTIKVYIGFDSGTENSAEFTLA